MSERCCAVFRTMWIQQGLTHTFPLFSEGIWYYFNPHFRSGLGGDYGTFESDDYDSAFGGLNLISSFPDELKSQSYSLTPGGDPLSIDFTFPDAECGGGEQDFLAAFCDIQLSIRVCNPGIVLKFDVDGVAPDAPDTTLGSPPRTNDGFVIFYRIRIPTNAEQDAIHDEGYTDENDPRYHYHESTQLLYTHGTATGSQCEMVNVHCCKVLELEEGEYYFLIRAFNGAGYTQDGEAWNLTIEAACQDGELTCEGADNCDDEDSGIVLPSDPDQPQPPNPGGCCGNCAVWGLELTFAGLTSSYATLGPDSEEYFYTPAVLNRTFSLSWSAGENAFAQLLGTEGDACDAGLLLGTFINHSVGPAWRVRYFAWKIVADTWCEECEGGRKWHGSYFLYTQFVYDEAPFTTCGTVDNSWSWVFSAYCPNLVFATVVEQPCVADCADSRVKYSNDHNVDVAAVDNGLGDFFIDCVDQTSVATLLYKPLAYPANCAA